MVWAGLLVTAVGAVPPGDPEPNQCVMGWVHGQAVRTFACGDSWGGTWFAVPEWATNRGRACIGGVCVLTYATGPQPVRVEPGMYREGGPWIAHVKYDIRWQGTGTMADCDGDEQLDCCTGWTELGITTNVVVDYLPCQ